MVCGAYLPPHLSYPLMRSRRFSSELVIMCWDTRPTTIFGRFTIPLATVLRRRRFPSNRWRRRFDSWNVVGVPLLNQLWIKLASWLLLGSLISSFLGKNMLMRRIYIFVLYSVKHILFILFLYCRSQFYHFNLNFLLTSNLYVFLNFNEFFILKNPMLQNFINKAGFLYIFII